ncbi:hypothetical protein J5N97_022050 [Dioscorea zingiberensis]|uniref:Uncharacterized protein n=1 Tax=Dioscorea zingiberensis TaxID=325984 RepID=A0A9D5CAF8_9LILI|nr:hypothetical protein J5N97_022050 [Dioscorea zingiberensis]
MKRKSKNSSEWERPKKKGEKCAVATRCSISDMYSLMEVLKADDTKKKILEQTIFKPYTDLPKRFISLGFVQALIENFDESTESFKIGNSRISFCVEEVQRCLGLPYFGKPVEVGTKRKPPMFLHKYFPQLKLHELRRTKVIELLREFKTEGDEWEEDFLKLCILYMFNVYFFANNDSAMSFWPLKYMDSMDDFWRRGWGQAIYKYLLHSLKSIAKAQNDSETYKHIYLKGCVPLLEALALERLELRCSRNDLTSKVLILRYNKSDTRSLHKLREELRNFPASKITSCENCNSAAAECLDMIDSRKKCVNASDKCLEESAHLYNKQRCLDLLVDGMKAEFQLFWENACADVVKMLPPDLLHTITN